MKNYKLIKNGTVENIIVLENLADYPLEPGQTLEEIVDEEPTQTTQSTDFESFPITRL
jgi:hypothetical protein